MGDENNVFIANHYHARQSMISDEITHIQLIISRYQLMIQSTWPPS